MSLRRVPRRRADGWQYRTPEENKRIAMLRWKRERNARFFEEYRMRRNELAFLATAGEETTEICEKHIAVKNYKTRTWICTMCLRTGKF